MSARTTKRETSSKRVSRRTPAAKNRTSSARGKAKGTRLTRARKSRKSAISPEQPGAETLATEILDQSEKQILTVDDGCEGETPTGCDQASGACAGAMESTKLSLPAANLGLPFDGAAIAETLAEIEREAGPEATDPWWKRVAGWVQSQVKVRRTKKRLRVCESVSLCEKRFVAVIQVDGEEFLVGGASNSVSTLARLEHNSEFTELLKQRWSEGSAQA